MPGTHLRFARRPSDIGLLLAVLRTSAARKRKPEAALELRASWHDIRLDPRHLQSFHAACGLDVNDGISIMYPMTLSYPLIQHMLSNAAAPMPLFRMLNTRMLMQQYRPLSPDARPSVDIGVTAVRRVSKGLELDAQVRMEVDGTPMWDCFMTFLYRGRFPGEVGTSATETPLRVVQPQKSASWTLPASGALRFGRLSGDTNPIHYGSLYAKAFGFERDFAQPLLVLGQAISRLPRLSADRPQRLEARLKGPVYYERNLKMLAGNTPTGTCFEIYCAPNTRPSICAQFGSLA